MYVNRTVKPRFTQSFHLHSWLREFMRVHELKALSTLQFQQQPRKLWLCFMLVFKWSVRKVVGSWNLHTWPGAWKDTINRDYWYLIFATITVDMNGIGRWQLQLPSEISLSPANLAVSSISCGVVIGSVSLSQNLVAVQLRDLDVQWILHEKMTCWRFSKYSVQVSENRHLLLLEHNTSLIPKGICAAKRCMKTSWVREDSWALRNRSVSSDGMFVANLNPSFSADVLWFLSDTHTHTHKRKLTELGPKRKKNGGNSNFEQRFGWEPSEDWSLVSQGCVHCSKNVISSYNFCILQRSHCTVQEQREGFW